jgi:hypothetical protein
MHQARRNEYGARSAHRIIADAREQGTAGKTLWPCGIAAGCRSERIITLSLLRFAFQPFCG